MLLPFVLHHDHLITSLVATPRLFARPPTAKLIIISLIMGTTVGEVVSSCDRCASCDYDERRRIMRTSKFEIIESTPLFRLLRSITADPTNF